MGYESLRDRLTRHSDVVAGLTGAFLQSLTQPSDALPTIRCLSRAEATKLVLAARDSILATELRSESAAKLLSLLETSGVLQPLALEGSRPSLSLYAVGPQNTDTLDPIDLLVAAQPIGVVCYFTALQYYGLTTQNPSHHHVAKLTRRTTEPARQRPVIVNHEKDGAPKRSRNSLGTRLFIYQAVPYYQTSRGEHTIAGIQRRQISDRTIARITTREQTLLDTLHKPLSCGGASVVWEAWQIGLSDIDEDRLLTHLRDLGDRRLLRRVGYMLGQMGYRPGADLSNLLSDIRTELDQTPDLAAIPLMPGLPAARLDAVWRVALPTL